MRIFISHITEEAPIALLLKEIIERKFLSQISVFASNDVHDLTPGEKWLQKIEAALKEANLMLVICSPSSLTRPWINFEMGCAWIKGIEIIPICHSGQGKKLLPHPFSELQSLQLEDTTFVKSLLQALCKYFGISPLPHVNAAAIRDKFKKVVSTISLPEASPQIIHSPEERTKLINSDLETLLRSESIADETVWTSAFLSTLAIGRNDPYPEEQQNYLKLLLKERDLLLSLARKGCTVKCIISPANENHLRHAGVNYAIQRTQRLLKLLKSKDPALRHIDWAISELGTKNLYIIGHISCFEGYKKDTQHGYGLTLRQTARDVISANIDVYSGFFKDLAARSLAKWANQGDLKESSERELLRVAARRCLEESLAFLVEFSKSMPRSNKAVRGRHSRAPGARLGRKNSSRRTPR